MDQALSMIQRPSLATLEGSVCDVGDESGGCIEMRGVARLEEELLVRTETEARRGVGSRRDSVWPCRLRSGERAGGEEAEEHRVWLTFYTSRFWQVRLFRLDALFTSRNSQH